MTIKASDRPEIVQFLTSWAKDNKAKLTVREPLEDENPDNVPITVAKGDWRVEVVPQNGWAYVHGKGSLTGISTNISEIDELDVAIDRLLKVAKEGLATE